MKKLNARDISELTKAQRNVLLEHIDGPIPLERNGLDRKNSFRIHTINYLLGKGLLRNGTHDAFTQRPRALCLTEAGREVVAAILAGYAEALIAAGCLEPGFLSPLKILERLKTERKSEIQPKTALEPAVSAMLALK